MVEDNKNNDTKEELKISSDDKNMDTQQTNGNKDLEKIKIEKKKKEDFDKLEETQSEKVEETQSEKVEETQSEKEEEVQSEKVEENKASDNKEEKEQEVNQTKKKDDPNVKWYVVGAASGFEERAIETIKDNARKASLSHYFFDFQIPKQEVVEIRKGKKINSEKKFFPGYMLIKMIINNQTWQLVKNSNKVSGFTGNDHKPIPLPQNEAMKMLKKADDSIEYIAPKYVYEVGQQVKVIDGPFASFSGMVEEVDEERGKLKISVSIFGRATPVELEYVQVEKI